MNDLDELDDYDEEVDQLIEEFSYNENKKHLEE